MTQPGWLLASDGEITAYAGGVLAYVNTGALELLFRRPDVVASIKINGRDGQEIGSARPSDDRSRVWFDIGGATFFAWHRDLHGLVNFTTSSAPLQTVHGMTSAPARSAGPLHA